ncbi:hypothetical protein FQZ97_524270 [compost metagenome]
MFSARAHAASSVSARIGRNDTEKRTLRPCFAASARTRVVSSRAWSSDSPHSAYTSAYLPATGIAASDAPPKYTGTCGLPWRVCSGFTSENAFWKR